MRLAEGVRGLLEVTFDRVYLVADLQSLRDGAQRLLPAMIVLDLSIAEGDLDSLLTAIRNLAPTSRIVVLTIHDDPHFALMALRAGAHGVVLNRCVGNDLLQAIDQVLSGAEYVSPDFGVIRQD